MVYGGGRVDYEVEHAPQKLAHGVAWHCCVWFRHHQSKLVAEGKVDMAPASQSTTREYTSIQGDRGPKLTRL
jgi:hypothetical protein